jgi:hypothetical protein
MDGGSDGMRDRKPTPQPDAPGEVAEWDATGPTRDLAVMPALREGLLERLGTRLDALVARALDLMSRRAASGDEDAAQLARRGGPVARWVSFPRGVRIATAATAGSATALAAWGVLAMAGNELGMAAAAAAAALTLTTAAGPMGVRMANRLHRLIGGARRCRISELRALPDRRAVAVRGVVVARRTASSALDNRQAVWALTRFRKSALLASSFFHEVAFDFLLDDGTDEPILIEVAGGMLLDPFPPDERVQFHTSTLLEIEHPFLTRLRLDNREVLGAELTIAPGDVVEVVGRLSRKLDPTAPSESGRDQPQRRALRSGTRVPVMVKRIVAPEPELARVRRLLPKGPPEASSGEPPVRKF